MSVEALRSVIAHFGFSFDEKSLKKVDDLITGTIGSLKNFAGAAASAFAVHQIYEFVHGLTEQADALAKQSRTMGVSLKDMQEWNYAAMMQGVSAEALSASLAKLSAGKYDKKAMAELGIKPEQAGKMKSGSALMGEIADKLAAIDDPAKRNAIAMKVLGRSYKNLMPLLLDGSEGIDQLRGEFADMGGGFTDEFAHDADEFGDSIDRLKTRWKLFGITIVSKILPQLVKISDWFVHAAPKLLRFVQRSNILQLATAALAVHGIMKLSAALGPLNGSLLRLAAVIGPLLVLEDVVTFFRGGKSITGDVLNKLFPPETVERIRTSVPKAIKEATDAFDELTNPKRKGQLAEDWELIKSKFMDDTKRMRELSRGANTLTVAFFNWLTPLGLAAKMWTAIFSVQRAVAKLEFAGIQKVVDFISHLLRWRETLEILSAVWSFHVAMVKQNLAELSGLWKLFMSVLVYSANAFSDGWSVAVALVKDAFINMWNHVLTAGQAALKLLAKGAAAVGATDTGNKLTAAAAALEGGKGTADSATTARAEIADPDKKSQPWFKRMDAQAKAAARRAKDRVAKEFGLDVLLAKPTDDNGAAGRAAYDANHAGDQIIRPLSPTYVPKEMPPVANGPITSSVSVNVTVPPTTPAEMAKVVGNAAGAATLRATKAAIVPGG